MLPEFKVRPNGDIIITIGNAKADVSLKTLAAVVESGARTQAAIALKLQAELMSGRLHTSH